MIKFLDTNFEYTDERGTIIQLVRDGWKQINYITTKAGVLRGKHYHKHNEEAFYVISGEFELELTNIKNGKKEIYTMKEKDFFLIKSYVSHSFKYAKDTTLISMYSNGVEEGDSKDTYVD